MKTIKLHYSPTGMIKLIKVKNNLYYVEITPNEGFKVKKQFNTLLSASTMYEQIIKSNKDESNN